MIFSTGCAGGRCRRRARPGKEAEGRLSLRILGYYITGISYCKVKLYDLYPVFRLFCLCWAKKYRPQPWAARWDGAGRPSGPSVVPAGTSLSPAVPTPARTPGRGATCSAQTPGIRFPVTPQWRITSSGAGKTGRTVLPSHSPAGSFYPISGRSFQRALYHSPRLGATGNFRHRRRKSCGSAKKPYPARYPGRNRAFAVSGHPRCTVAGTAAS